jgi:23S rRNA pseudouridine2605 synthase
VNGRVAGLGESADPARDRIELDGRPVDLGERAYWVLHKPRGVVSTRRDPQGRPTLLDLLPAAAQALRLFPVGRLDLDSEGLVLLTNDGDLAQVLLHPSYESEKEYVVTVRGRPGEAALRRLAAGLELAPGTRPTAPAEVARLAGGAASGECRLRIVLREGRKRQIRRSLAQLGFPVRRLVRVRIGPLRLHGLAPAEARPLRPGERAALRRYAARRPADTQLAPQGRAPARESGGASRLRPRPRKAPESR